MHPEVDWPNGWEGGRERGPRRGARLLDAPVDAHRLARRAARLHGGADGRIAVDVHQTVRDYNGDVLSDGRVTHVYTMREGLVMRMDIVARG